MMLETASDVVADQVSLARGARPTLMIVLAIHAKTLVHVLMALMTTPACAPSATMEKIALSVIPLVQASPVRMEAHVTPILVALFANALLDIWG